MQKVIKVTSNPFPLPEVAGASRSSRRTCALAGDVLAGGIDGKGKTHLLPQGSLRYNSPARIFLQSHQEPQI